MPAQSWFGKIVLFLAVSGCSFGGPLIDLLPSFPTFHDAVVHKGISYERRFTPSDRWVNYPRDANGLVHIDNDGAYFLIQEGTDGGSPRVEISRSDGEYMKPKDEPIARALAMDLCERHPNFGHVESAFGPGIAVENGTWVFMGLCE